jgi:hypothetical protein
MGLLQLGALEVRVFVQQLTAQEFFMRAVVVVLYINQLQLIK